MFPQGTTRGEPPCLSQDSQSTCDREEESSAGRDREESSEGRGKKIFKEKQGGSIGGKAVRYKGEPILIKRLARYWHKASIWEGASSY